MSRRMRDRIEEAVFTVGWVLVLVWFAATACHAREIARHPVMGIEIEGYDVQSVDPVAEYVNCDLCTIRSDGGGVVLRYEAVVAIWKRAPLKMMRVDGDCWSACSLMVAELAEQGQACFTDRAMLAVHQASTTLDNGDVLREPIPYPRRFQRWITMRGGAPSKGWLPLYPAQLARLMPRCDD